MAKTISLVITSTPDQAREKWVLKTLEAIDKFTLWFDEKILIVDEFDGLIYPDCIIDKFIKCGFKINKYNLKSRGLTLLDTIEKINSDLVMYLEDDIEVLRMPNSQDIKSLFANNNIGIMSFGIGGSSFSNTDWGDIKSAKERIIYNKDDIIVFERLALNATPYFFELGCVILNKELFHTCIKRGMSQRTQFERDLTWALFSSGLINIYKKVSVVNDNFLNLIQGPLDVRSIDVGSRLINILDPQQGDYPHKGNVNY